MAYQALYRKYRSQRFDEMVGQEVVATTLKNAIVNHQISHAYLFSGPRGTGKTSAAKIFAKAINCPNQVDGEPCNNCFICDSITKGSLDDVIELDAASNNGVDEIREIRDKSTYAASQATYKVYIIDEVHMLSTGAFNALLKTLEEPTENVLATTELQKIPATIISRVQRFAFKSITTGDIRTYLAKIMADEGLEFDGKALDVIAKAAEGGMRDALSLLDQALSFSSGKLEENDALLVTGSIAADALVTYVAALFEHDEAKALTELDKIFAEGKNMLRFTEDLLAYLRDLLLDKNSQYDRGQIFSWIDIAIESLKTIKETTQTKIAADVMTMRLAEIGQNNLLTASQGEIPNQLTAEIATLKTEINQLKAQISAGQIQVNSDSQNNLLTEKVKGSSKPIASKKRQINKDLIYKALAEATNEARKAALSAWPELVASVTKPADRALLNNTAPVAASENFLVVTFPHENLAKRVSENEELQLFCGNLLSSIVGFAPEIISLAEQDWQEVRAEYVSNLKSENVQEDEEDEKEPDETVNLAKQLFGEKVVEIND